MRQLLVNARRRVQRLAACALLGVIASGMLWGQCSVSILGSWESSDCLGCPSHQIFRRWDHSVKWADGVYENYGHDATGEWQYYYPNCVGCIAYPETRIDCPPLANLPETGDGYFRQTTYIRPSVSCTASAGLTAAWSFGAPRAFGGSRSSTITRTPARVSHRAQGARTATRQPGSAKTTTKSVPARARSVIAGSARMTAVSVRVARRVAADIAWTTVRFVTPANPARAEPARTTMTNSPDTSITVTPAGAIRA